jgi:hypothetical protein
MQYGRFFFTVVVAGVFIVATHTSYPFALFLRRQIRKAALFARDHHEDADVSDWHWQESREALLFWYNWTKHHPSEVEAEYHELFVLNSEGEAVDVVPPDLLWKRAIHVGLLPPRGIAELPIMDCPPAASGLRSPA